MVATTVANARSADQPPVSPARKPASSACFSYGAAGCSVCSMCTVIVDIDVWSAR